MDCVIKYIEKETRWKIAGFIIKCRRKQLKIPRAILAGYMDLESMEMLNLVEKGIRRIPIERFNTFIGAIELTSTERHALLALCYPALWDYMVDTYRITISDDWAVKTELECIDCIRFYREKLSNTPKRRYVRKVAPPPPKKKVVTHNKKSR